MATFEEYTRKKKRQAAAGLSFQDYTVSLLGEDALYKNASNASNRVVIDKVETKKKKEKDTWFKSGAFGDGKGNILTDTALTYWSTIGDAYVGAAKGIVGLVEGVADLGMYGVAGAADLVGADGVAKTVRGAAKKNATNAIYSPAEKLVDKYSVLGNKSDAVSQGAGQVLGIIATGGAGAAAGLGTAGVTALTTGLNFASSAGSGMSEAYQGGATDKEAAIYGGIKGTIDASTELLFGGLGKITNATGISKGIGGFDDMVADYATKKITNQLVKNTAKYGLKAAGEGAEEVLAGYLTAHAKQIYSEEDLSTLIEDENLLDQFIVGSLVGGIASTPSLVQANVSGRDYTSGLTANEQKVVDAEVQRRIAEQETDGKKLSKKEQSKITEQVREELKRGSISTDVIESALVGDNETYKNYQSIAEQEKALNEQIKEVQNNAALTATQKDVLTKAFKSEIEALNKTEAQGKLMSEIDTLTEKDTYLRESYNEKGRRTQKFEADLSKYDDNQKEVIQRAIDSGILNNTNRTHEFVDFLAKVSSDKGVLFDFTNNEKIKEDGLAIEGTTVNGYVKDGTIAVNIQSNKALNTVVGHEVTHTLEGTEQYTELQNMIIEYAKTKGDYQARYDELSKLYEGVENANIENELTADLVGDYLFTDSKFIEELSVTKPNIFKRIYQEIKHLLKLATGSKEARQLEQVKRAFDKAYKQTNATNITENVKYELEAIANMTEESYNHHGWAKVNDILNDTELADFQSKVGEKNKNGKWYLELGNGRYMFAVGENGVNSTLIISDGDFNAPSIEKVYHIGLNNETDIETVRDVIYESEKDSEWTLSSVAIEEVFGSEIVRSYTGKDFETFQQQSRKYEGTKSKVDIRFDSDLQDGSGSNTETKTTINNEVSSTDDAFFDAQNDTVKYSLSPEGKMVDNKGNEVTLNASEAGTHGTLMAIRNINEGELRGMLEINGIPVPSIAITDPAKVDHTSFGSISVLFDKTTIDPANKKNEVYDRDIWSSRFPTLDYEIDRDKAINLYDRARSVGEIAFFNPTNLEPYNIENKMKRGEQGLIEDYKNDYGMKNFYLAETSSPVEMVEKENVIKISEAEKDMFDFFIHNMGKEIAEYKTMDRKEWYSKYGEQYKALEKEYYMNVFGFTEEEAANVVDNTKPFKRVSQVKHINDYTQNGGTKTEVVNDLEATRKEIDSKLDQKEYEAWLKNSFKGIEKSVGIPNGKDPYTANGRRTFKQLHDPYTLENLVKNMTKGRTQGGEITGGGASVGAISANMATKYNSIADIKKDESRIRADADAIIQPLKDKLGKSIDELRKYYNGDSFNAYDSASSAVFELSSKKLTESNFRNILKDYYFDVDSIPSEVLQEVINDLNALKDIPTDYFESKPQRAVGLDEVQAVVIPNTTDIELKKELSDRGFNVIEYDPNIEGDRQTKINRFDELKFSLSNQNQDIAPVGSYNVYGRDIALETTEPAVVEDIAPVREDVVEVEAPNDYIPLVEEVANWRESVKNLKEPEFDGDSWSEDYLDYHREFRNKLEYAARKEIVKDVESGMLDNELLQKSVEAYKEYENLQANKEYGEPYTEVEELTLSILYNQYALYRDIAKNPALINELRESVADYAPLTEEMANERDAQQQNIDTLNEAPEEIEAPYYSKDEDIKLEDPFDERDIKDVGKRNVKAYMYENPEVKPYFQQEAQAMLWELQNSVKGEKSFNSQLYYDTNGELGWFGTTRETSDDIAYLLDNFKYTYADIEKGLKAIIEDHGAENNAISKRIEFALNDRLKEGYTDFMSGIDVPANQDYVNLLMDKQINTYSDEAYYEWLQSLATEEAPPLAPLEPSTDDRDVIAPTMEDIASLEGAQRVMDFENNQIVDEVQTESDTKEQENKIYHKSRKELKQALIKDKENFLIDAMDEAKNVPVLLLNNTDTIRATELVFGRENAKLINKVIFQKAIDNEAKSIAWQNKERAEIKKLGIKPKSKESAAVQKYGEKQYENAEGKMVEYGDVELALEFPNVATQKKIKRAAQVMRNKYDRYIDEANAVLTELGFNPIQKRKDYMRHFEALTDAFSRMGIPFNIQQMKEYDLPTDINGLTDTFVPQKNFFANIMQRKGNKTTLDAVTGIDGYIGGISNLIHHTEDIQRGRAFEDLIRDSYGRKEADKVLSGIVDETAKQKRKQQIADNHLSGYASWVHDWTDNLAGKKDIADRGAERRIGRRIFTVLDTIRKQVGANMIGFNVSSSLTNLIAPVQALAKTNKAAFTKGTIDTFRSIFKKDSFMDNNSFLTSRMGTDKLSKTWWEKTQDAGFIFMKGMDYFTSNLIVRSKYNELVSKGVSEEVAHKEAGQFAARIMGDRTKGANPQLYNSKLFNMVAQFQLEVNNQLYSMFYDTYHESKEKAKGSALRTASGMTFTLGQLFIATHIFGQAFEKVAGYNPTFDVIDIIKTALGLGDEEEEEKPLDERLEDASLKLLKALPYSNLFVDGGRIPMGNALPISQFIKGVDEYGNEKSRTETLAEALPYYLAPAGYGQIKKSVAGLGMFDDNLPVAGSYTDSGNLRFPIEDTGLNRVQATIFGQWANENARDYIDNERQPLKDKQIQEFADLDIPIQEYWEYREGLKEQDTIEEKFDYIAGLDLPVSKKNILINNVVDREEKVNLINYDDFSGYEEFDFATKNPEKYEFFKSNNISYADYSASEESKEAYSWAYKNPEKYVVSKAVGDVVQYKKYTKELNKLEADKDEDGKSISGSRKEKVINYINGMEADYGAKIILYKSEYPSDDTYNNEIVEYLNSRNDITYAEMVTILTELGFMVEADGTVRWE